MSKSDAEEHKREDNSAWDRTRQWLHEAKNAVEVLVGDKEQGKTVLHRLQVSPKTLLGTIAVETGGILFDHGWLRFLGSGSESMKGNLLSWNSSENGLGLREAFIVAHDVVGGVFAINGGAFSGEKGNIFYMAADTLKWQDLHGSYSQLFSWAATGDLEQFYQNMRWPGWKDEITQIGGDQGFSIIPFLWASTDIPISQRSRRIVPMTELWNIEQDIAQQTQNLPTHTPIRINLTE